MQTLRIDSASKAIRQELPHFNWHTIKVRSKHHLGARTHLPSLAGNICDLSDRHIRYRLQKRKSEKCEDRRGQPCEPQEYDVEPGTPSEVKRFGNFLGPVKSFEHIRLIRLLVSQPKKVALVVVLN